MSDNVEHPSHYSAGGIETIDAIKSALGDAFLDYCRGNVLKYVWRCRHKGKLLEDLRKAAKYLEWAIEEAENDVVEPTQPTKASDASIPDPGPGYRLLSKDPPERVVESDEFLCVNGEWYESENWRTSGVQCSAYYRRKIEPTEWIPKVGDKVRVVGNNPKLCGDCAVVYEVDSDGLVARVVSYDGKREGWLPLEHLELIEAAQ